MRLGLTLGVGAFALAFGLGCARANVITLGKYGYWDAFGGIANDGSQVCGASEFGTDARGFLIKWFKGTPHLTIQIFKSGWHIPVGVPVKVVLQFDHAAPWSAEAQAVGKGDGLEFYVPIDHVDTFVNEVRFASEMILAFPEGTESPWVGRMVGSNMAMLTMMHCMRIIAGGSTPQTSQPTQPYVQPTQPFGSGDAPAPQPYTVPRIAPAPRVPENQKPVVPRSSAGVEQL